MGIQPIPPGFHARLYSHYTTRTIDVGRQGGTRNHTLILMRDALFLLSYLAMNHFNTKLKTTQSDPRFACGHNHQHGQRGELHDWLPVSSTFQTVAHRQKPNLLA